MDFVYNPEIAAMLTDWIMNVSPVPDAQQVLESEGASSVAKNPLVFPTPDTYGRLHGYRILSAEEDQQWEDLFLAVYQS
jgi:spermidine/putrescine transport system substrate-binding protein